MIEIVSATRLSEADFWSRAALGLSLRRLVHDGRIARHVVCANARGLPELFNARIDASGDADMAADALVFVHDDVWLEDMFVVERVLEGLARFDVIGVAGNRRRLPRQPAWLYADDTFARDDPVQLTGSVAHGKLPFGEVSYFGPTSVACELLDGVLLAARRSALRAANVRFDARFPFHLYDVDFCRSARTAGLALGTWPLALTHQSAGAFNSPAWRESWRVYLEKWGE
jgi:GT2 family glycosyltransferase